MYENAIELDPMNAYFYMHVGKACEAMGGEENKAKGEKFQRLALEIAPDDPQLRWQTKVEQALHWK